MKKKVGKKCRNDEVVIHRISFLVFSEQFAKSGDSCYSLFGLERTL